MGGAEYIIKPLERMIVVHSEKPSLDNDDVGPLSEAFEAYGKKHLLFDMRYQKRVSSRMLGEMLGMLTCETDDHKFVHCNVGEDVNMIFDLMGLSNMFTMCMNTQVTIDNYAESGSFELMDWKINSSDLPSRFGKVFPANQALTYRNALVCLKDKAGERFWEEQGRVSLGNGLGPVSCESLYNHLTSMGITSYECLTNDMG